MMKRLNWNTAIYYGEIFGFFFAWAVCLVVAFSQAEKEGESSDATTFAAADSGSPTLD